MPRIEIALPADRSRYGSIRVVADDGATAVGPFAVLGKADERRAAERGNWDCDPAFPYGDTPTGTYIVRGIVESGPGTRYKTKAYGDQGVIRLEPVAGDVMMAKLNGRTGVIIQGGQLNEHGGLRPTVGGLRVRNEDLGEIRAAYETLSPQTGIPGVCTVAETESADLDLGPDPPGPPGGEADTMDDAADPPPGFKAVAAES
jgi:hypothetical protein